MINKKPEDYPLTSFKCKGCGGLLRQKNKYKEFIYICEKCQPEQFTTRRKP